MFTGIIGETGSVVAFDRGDAAWRLRIDAPLLAPEASLGDSIAVNGCCLTVVTAGAERLEFDVLEETRRLTNFAAFAVGTKANLEASLRIGGKAGGHFVSGHIDGPGIVEVFEARGADRFLRVGGPPGCARYLIQKGSIAIDGVSLTVAETDGDRFAVWLVPHTLKATNLAGRVPGDVVNLEFDMLGKYVEKQLLSRGTL